MPERACEVELRSALCGKLPQAGWMLTFPGIPVLVCNECWEFYATAFPETLMQELPRG